MSFLDLNDLEKFETSNNPYLVDPEKALELIAAVYSGKQENFQVQRVLKKTQILMTKDLLNAMLRIPLLDFPVFDQVQKIYAKISEQTFFPYLTGKTVIGVGGKFSTGKSCFLNSITGCENLLPINQQPTTSIPTYITYGNKEVSYAYTIFNKTFEIDQDMMHALTHEFYEKYSIGFAKSIEKLIVLKPEFPFNKIALLDTPGYNKADITPNYDTIYVNEEVVNSQDARIARAHLQNCDYLLWLISAQAGTIHDADIQFLRSLSLQQPCLVVLTQADKKTPDNIQKILDSIESELAKTNIPVAAVTAYSAHENREYFEKNLISDYIKHASEAGVGQENLSGQMKVLIEIWNEIYHNYNNKNAQKISEYEEMLQAIWDPAVVSFLVSLLKERNIRATSLYHIRNNVNTYQEVIFQNLKILLKEDR